MGGWKLSVVSCLILLWFMLDARGEKSEEEIDKYKWIPKLRDPVKVRIFFFCYFCKFGLKVKAMLPATCFRLHA